MTVSARARIRVVVLALLAALLAALGGIVSISDASASPTTPTSMEIRGITGLSGPDVPEGLADGALPSVLAEPGTPLTLHVTLSDATTGTATSFSSDTSVSISTNVGTLTSTRGTIPAGATEADLSTSLTSAVNRVRLTVTVVRGPAKNLAGTAPDALVFDVLTDIRTTSLTAGTPFTGGIGGDDGQCTNASRQNPVCGVVVLPSGARSGALLSTGLCDAAYQCDSRGALIQTLFGSTRDDGTPLYDSTHPATLILKCDKSLCGGGAIKNVPVHFTLAGNGALGTAAEACPARGTVGAGQDACVDYVQSTRDGAGDTILYLLFPHDMRGSVG